MQVLTVIPERLPTTLPTAVIVTMESALDGSVSRGTQVQECQLHVRRITDVAQVQPAGWMVDTP